MAEIKIDFSKKIGPMKPMHGVNNGPLTCNFSRDARPLFKEAGIPFSRLHDTEYPFGSGEFVDITCIFKNFDADVNDPDSYNFALTDLYLKAIDECDTKIIYRLGVSIEHNPVKRHIFPPRSFEKWAQICEHIIMHYNYGWADGYNLGIEYWEIWNEPNHAKDLKMWGGPAEDFAHLYDTAAKHLKNRFPELKIGGPAFSNPDGEFVDAFFTELTKDGNHPPMDFYSWHGYIDNIESAVDRAYRAENTLKKYGYDGAESIHDEWNYVKSWKDMKGNIAVMHSHKGAAFNAAIMSAMQNAPCDIMAFYDAQMKFSESWCSLFSMGNDYINGGANILIPQKPFFAFKAFNEVYKCKEQVSLSSDDERLYVVAASNGDTHAVLVSSFAAVDEELSEKEVAFKLCGTNGKTAEIYMCDESNDLKKIGTVLSEEFSVVMKPYSFLLVKFS